jgi:bifunctional UDP-N-acetylglucosamine pyrophosphorylase/glucosamine-1-phosphate N-acetyltransferase
MSLAVVILAAGQGTRMRSRLPKALHPVAGQPMIVHAFRAAEGVGDSAPVVVVGGGADQVQELLGERARYVLQKRQQGTGHALLQAKALLAGRSEVVLVMCADMPLLKRETLLRLVERHQKGNAVLTMLTVARDDPQGFGRVLRDGAGAVVGIVEDADATPEQLAIRELDTATFCFDADWLWPRLDQIPAAATGEYYLTGLVGMAVAEGSKVAAMAVDDSVEVLGVNSRVHLAEVEAAFRRRINEGWMLEGVTIVDPATTFIGADVVIGTDTVIQPNTFLEGTTSIGAECRIGPNTVIRDSKLGERCIVFASVLEGSTLEEGVDVGPFAHLRKGAHLAAGVHMGNFGEIKNSYLGPGTKMGHFSYVGDATIGSKVNIGAGTITCNYDGKRKHRTEIEDGAFIGSDTMLVAPLRVGKGARTGAGAVVTRDVPPDSLAFGVPARVKDPASPPSAGADASEPLPGRARNAAPTENVEKE